MKNNHARWLDVSTPLHIGCRPAKSAIPDFPLWFRLRPLALLAVVLCGRLIADTPWESMDYGGWIASSVTLPWSKNGEDLDGIVLKGLTFQLGPDAATFDTGELRWACAVTNSRLILMGTPFDGTHRPPERSRPSLTGVPTLASSHGPGWAVGGDWRDLRSEPYVPVRKEQAHYLGLIRADGRGVLHYTVGDATVFDCPGAGMLGGDHFFARSIAIRPHTNSISLLVGEDRLEYREHVGFLGKYPQPGAAQIFLGHLAAEVDHLPAGAHWRVVSGNRLTLDLPPVSTNVVFTLLAGRVAENARDRWHPTTDPAPARTVAALAAATKLAEGQVQWTPRFNAVLPVPGRLGSETLAYGVDSIPMPTANPWKAWMRPSGFDFFENGNSAAICTWSGDVWRVTGLSGSLDHVEWRRIAAGLFQPLGLKIVAGKVYVLCRDEIVRLDDFDGDGEADEISNFNNDVSVTPNFHEFALDLQADSKGNFYFTKGGPLLGTDYWDPIGAHNGCVIKVSSDGNLLERYATGLRAPNGSGMGPRDELVCSDNEGIWTPVCRLNWVRPGGFYGAMGLDHRAEPPIQFDPPLCWLPYAVDNSSGSQVWAPLGFGPLAGELIHLSYGKCRAFHVLTQTIGDTMQGGVTPLPWRFDSSAMRARSNPVDGSLWVAGLKGWQTTAISDGALHRVRWLGTNFPCLTGFQVLHDGFELRFSEPVQDESAVDPGSWNIQWWNYSWGSQYGSDLYSVTNSIQKTGRKGELKGDAVSVVNARISADHRSIRLLVPVVQPVMQIAVRAAIKTFKGNEFPVEYYGSIHVVPDSKISP